MRGIVFALLLASTQAQAAYYTDEPDPAYIKVTTAVFCMNHFQNRTSGNLGARAAIAVQDDLAARLATLGDAKKTAEAIRMAVTEINKPQANREVPYTCWTFIPKDHGLDQQEIEYFLDHSQEK